MFADIGIGIFIALTGFKFFNIPFSYSFLMISIIFMLLPDLDFIIEIIFHGRVGGKKIREHREITHFPIVYIILSTVLSLFNHQIGILFLTCTLIHLIHDSIGIGWGIKWLWPFSSRTYKLFSDKNGRTTINQFIASWTPKDLASKVKKYGNENWISDIYFRLTPISIIEYAILIAAIVTLILFII